MTYRAVTSWLVLVSMLGIMLLALSLSTARAADRKVLFEEFTATWCGPCVPVGQALSDLLNNYPDDVAFIQIHGSDSYTYTWGIQRASFYGLTGFPTIECDGILEQVGAYPSSGQNYAIFQNWLNQRLNDEADVEIAINADLVNEATHAYHVTLTVGLDAGALPRQSRIHLVYVRDHYPSGSHYRNCMLSGITSPTVVSLTPGNSQIVEYDITMTNFSVPSNLRLVAWAQSTNGSAPAEVYNANWSAWPFEPSMPDCNENGIDDADDIAGGTSGDCDSNDIPDECQIADGTAEDCNNNGVPDACDIADGVLEDCDEDGVPDSCQVAEAYAAHDGSAEQGASFGGGDMVWLTHHLQNPANGPILGVTLQWYYFPADFHTTVLLYDDPNEDGDPSDAVLLSSATVMCDMPPGGYCSQENENGTVTVLFDNPVEPGASFFIGAAATYYSSHSPAALDTTSPDTGGDNWIALDAAGNADLENLAGNLVLAPISELGLDGNWLLSGLALSPPDCSSDCVLDIDGNGDVGFQDLITLLSSWGSCSGTCPADFNGNGTVDFSDLLQLLAGWGPC